MDPYLLLFDNIEKYVTLSDEEKELLRGFYKSVSYKKKQYILKEEKAERLLKARHLARREFWEGLLYRSRNKTNLFENRSGTYDNWMGISAGRRGFYLHHVINMDEAIVKVYIDPDEDTGEGNVRAFNELLEQKVEIEDDFGEKLEWGGKEGTRARIIKKTLRDKGLSDEDEWDSIQEWMIGAMIRLDNAFRDRIAKLKL